MIRTGAKPRRGVNLSSSGVEYESVYSQVCLYWVDVLESTYTDVFMESSRIVTCEPKCEAGGDSSTGFLPGNGMKFACWWNWTCTPMEKGTCVPSSCTCPLQLKAQLKTTRWNNDMGVKYDANTGEPTSIKGDDFVEKMIDYEFGGAMPKDWNLFRWENCVGTDCPGTQGVTN